MNIDLSLDDIINRHAGGSKARGKGGTGRGRAPRSGGRGAGIAKPRAPGGAKPRAAIAKPRGITKKATKVVVVGGKGGGKGRGRSRRANAAPDVLIGENTDIKLAAGAVANFLREGSPPVVKAISPHNVNQAVKTLALTRMYILEESLEICVTVDVRLLFSLSSLVRHAVTNSPIAGSAHPLALRSFQSSTTRLRAPTASCTCR